MDPKDIQKLAAVLVLYGFVAPALGVLLWWRPSWQRWVFGIVCFMSTGGFFQPQDWGFTVGFFEYRGHTKGYHFYFAEVFALALIIGSALQNWRRFRLVPPGLWLYLLYCAVSFVSIVNAPVPEYVVMAAFRFVKAAVFFVAAYNFFRTEDDLRFLIRAMGLTMLWQTVVVLKLKYLDGYYQVSGTFEHQNSLSMFVTMIGMVFLAVSLGPATRQANQAFGFFVACAVIQQATLSRAGMAMFAFGTLLVSVLSLADRFTVRRLKMIAALGCIGAVGLAMTMDTIVARFQDYGNEASGMTRKLLNRASRHMLEDYPLGIGWNNFGIAINKPFPYGQIIDQWERDGGAKVDETHQKGIAETHYFLLLAETGYQSLLAYLLFISLFLWWNLRAMLWFRSQFLGALSLGIAAGCGCNYLQSLLERVLTQPRNMMLWFLLLAATARMHTWRKAERKSLRTSSPPLPEPTLEPQI